MFIMGESSCRRHLSRKSCCLYFMSPLFFVGTTCVFVGFQLENWAEMSSDGTNAEESVS